MALDDKSVFQTDFWHKEDQGMITFEYSLQRK